LLDSKESFLYHIEKNGEEVFKNNQDDLLLPLIPFFQIVYVNNINEVLEQLLIFETETNGLLVRFNEYISLAVSESNYNEKQIRTLMMKLLEIMRY
jgi:hypothetical protein